MLTIQTTQRRYGPFLIRLSQATRRLSSQIYGGSVFQKVALLHPEKCGVIHVTGVNLPAVIQVLLSSEPITADSVDALMEEAREYLVRVDPLPEEGQGPNESDEGSDDGFFD